MDREAIVPLTIGLVLAIFVHLLAAPTLRDRLDEQESDYRLRARQADPNRPEPPQRLRQLTPGLTEHRSTQVNLVSYDHYQELMAQQSQVDQPAVQRDVEPDPAAQQTPVDPTPPRQAVADREQPVAAQPTPPSSAQRPSPPTPASPARVQDAAPPDEQSGESTEPPAPPLPDLPVARAESADEPDLLDRPSETEATRPGRIAMDLPEPNPASDLEAPRLTAPPMPPQPEQAPTRPQPASPPSPARQTQPAEQTNATERPQPTPAAREDFESPPVRRIEYARVQPGAVLSVRGVRIKTARPRYSVTAMMTTVPGDPVFTLHFNAQGKVIKVEKLRSTGYDNVDGPIVASLYKWTAKGPIPEEGLTLEKLRLLLRSSPRPGNPDPEQDDELDDEMDETDDEDEQP